MPGKRGDIHHLVPRVTFPRIPFLSASWDPKHTRPWFSTTICSFWRGDACALQVVKQAENVKRNTCKGREKMACSLLRTPTGLNLGRLLMAIQALLPVVQKNITAVPKSWDTQKGRIGEDMVRKLSLVNYHAKALLTGINLKNVWLLSPD